MNLSKSDNVRLNIGSSVISFEGWLNLDLPFFDLTRSDLWEFYFSEAPVNNILMEHVLEHLTPEEVRISLSLAKKYLHRDGMIRIAVPDKNHPNPAYLEYVKPDGSGLGADDHKSFWNYSEFVDLIQSLGFSYALKEYYNENGQLILNELNQDAGIIRRTARKKLEIPIEDYSSLIIDFWI